jgi:NAD(P)-dependent dehydrogenase (short-subunit alcohol dehydrogenase family)
MLDRRTPNFVFPSLRDRVAIITGAGQGLGSAFAKAFAASGAVAVIAERNGERGEVVAATSHTRGRARRARIQPSAAPAPPLGARARQQTGHQQMVALFQSLKSIQAGGHLGNTGVGARLVLFAAGGAGDADRADYLVADLDRHAATNRNYIRDLLQKGILRLVSQILKLKRGLPASASSVSLEAAKFHGVRIGPVAADGRSDVAGLINDYDGNLIAIFGTLLERALNDHKRHFHRNVLLDLWSLRTGRSDERE